MMKNWSTMHLIFFQISYKHYHKKTLIFDQGTKIYFSLNAQPEIQILNWLLKGTVIYREYSTDEGDPYYPVPNEKNRALYRKYQDLALKEPNVIFVGRLASYKYFNMDEVCTFYNEEILGNLGKS